MSVGCAWLTDHEVFIWNPLPNIQTEDNSQIGCSPNNQNPHITRFRMFFFQWKRMSNNQNEKKLSKWMFFLSDQTTISHVFSDLVVSPGGPSFERARNPPKYCESRRKSPVCDLNDRALFHETGKIRTSDPQIRNLMLYPAELRSHKKDKHCRRTGNVCFCSE